MKMVLLLALLLVPGVADAQFVMYDAGPRVDSIMASAEVRSESLRGDLDAIRAIRAQTPVSLVVTTLGSAHVNKDFRIGDDLLAATVHNNKGLAVVVIDLEKASRMGITDEELLHVLAHEVYGHASFYLLNNGRVCADPKEGTPYRRSCVANRESRVLEELGLEARAQYSIRTHESR